MLYWSAFPCSHNQFKISFESKTAIKSFVMLMSLIDDVEFKQQFKDS